MRKPNPWYVAETDPEPKKPAAKQSRKPSLNTKVADGPNPFDAQFRRVAFHSRVSALVNELVDILRGETNETAMTAAATLLLMTLETMPRDTAKATAERLLKFIREEIE